MTCKCTNRELGCAHEKAEQWANRLEFRRAGNQGLGGRGNDAVHDAVHDAGGFAVGSGVISPFPS